MQVILLERVGKLGAPGQVVKVKNGYGRNFLIPNKKALAATAQNLAVYEQKKADIERANEEKRVAALKQSTSMDGIRLVVIRQAGEDGRLFGSVTSSDISKLLAAKGFQIEKKDVVIGSPIRNLGIYPVRIELHAEVTVTIKLNVARTEAEAEAAFQAEANPKKAKGSAEEGDETAAEEAAAPKKKAAGQRKRVEKDAADDEAE